MRIEDEDTDTISKLISCHLSSALLVLTVQLKLVVQLL